MHTLGYNFKPWRAEKAIADGPAIWNYVNETADEYGIREQIRFGHKLIASSWSTESASWLLTVETSKGETQYFSCNFLLMCAGYYNYDAGHQPEFQGRDDFQGTWVHPQFWPEDLDYTGKKVVVIGSGATAMTLVPNMSQRAEKVTMVQRSPTYVVSRPSVDRVANFLRAIMPSSWAYGLVRLRTHSDGEPSVPERYPLAQGLLDPRLHGCCDVCCHSFNGTLRTRRSWMAA